MKRAFKRLFPILLAIVIICSVVWYLFVYDQDFTRDMLLQQARFFDGQGNHAIASWLYEQAYRHSDNNEIIAIELADQFKADGNYTKAEYTLSNAIADGGSVELYIALCKTYVEQDKLLDAVTMLDNITDEAIQKQLASMRPAAPVADPAPNFYSQYIPVSIQCNGGTLYLSTNGEYPSLNSGASNGSVTLVGGENTIFALCVGDNGLVSPLAIFGYTVGGVIEEVTLADSTIDAQIRKQLQLSAGETLYSNVLWEITSLELPDGAQKYTDLTWLTHLQKLTISNSSAESLEGIGSLSQLTELAIYNSSVSVKDLKAIASLPKLQKLTLSGCSLSDIRPLSSLKGLTRLDLSNNSIADVTPLSAMTQLTELYLGHNALDTLNALSPLTALKSLDISYNSIISIFPLSGCTALQELNVSNNKLVNLTGVEALTGLTWLDVGYNAISDAAPLVSCTALVRLNVSNNELADISMLSVLNKLQHFNFSHNQVAALPAWSTDCALVSIDGSYNLLKTIAGLAGFENLNTVMMDHNQISSVNALATCHNLIQVSVYGVPIADVSALTDQSIIVYHTPVS